MTSQTPGRAGRILLLALLAGLVPARAAENGPGVARPRIELGAEVWRLRPAGDAAAPPQRDARGRPVTEIPETRRNVRMVYPALTEARW
ncbi:hypothetical protein [Methylobacterium dankookense]|uniref:Uncharacterized protein n=1 Tax=Methylobacterium dankookense TaxID=560405 RepID=A0A564G7I4_9HYPH|nr:hypothetical protein [Methylobacterium dankookense]GJD59776.1 hypothetical protein IFDJLNFL_5707 [Methylobacterium dankookense]VUF15986.1 hypothetical protein MTDSW087_05735 [Methylobacterium dankookense]